MNIEFSKSLINVLDYIKFDEIKSFEEQVLDEDFVPKNHILWDIFVIEQAQYLLSEPHKRMNELIKSCTDKKISKDGNWII